MEGVPTWLYWDHFSATVLGGHTKRQHGVRKLRSWKWDTSTESDNNVTDINMESGSSGAGNGTRVQSQTTM